jgi:hypothetical protein
MMTDSSAPILSVMKDRVRIHKVVDAAQAVNDAAFFSKAQGDDVRALSKNTEFDSLEVGPDTVFQTSGDGFEASGIVYVTLKYGHSVSMPDSYPAVIKGTFKDDAAEITEISVDTSSFFK